MVLPFRHVHGKAIEADELEKEGMSLNSLTVLWFR